MKKSPDYLSAAIIVVWVITLLLLCAFGLQEANGQDTPHPITTFFTLSCYITDEGYATVLMQSDGEEHYTFDNVEGIDTTIPEAFTTSVGVEVLGRISIYGAYDLSFVREDGAVALLTMSEDWQVWCDKENTPPEGTPEPTEVPVEPLPYVQVIMSTGRTCIVKYPEIILVCNGG